MCALSITLWWPLTQHLYAANNAVPRLPSNFSIRLGLRAGHHSIGLGLEHVRLKSSPQLVNAHSIQLLMAGGPNVPFTDTLQTCSVFDLNMWYKFSRCIAKQESVIHVLGCTMVLQ